MWQKIGTPSLYQMDITSHQVRGATRLVSTRDKLLLLDEWLHLGPDGLHRLEQPLSPWQSAALERSVQAHADHEHRGCLLNVDNGLEFWNTTQIAPLKTIRVRPEVEVQAVTRIDEGCLLLELDWPKNFRYRAIVYSENGESRVLEEFAGAAISDHHLTYWDAHTIHVFSLDGTGVQGFEVAEPIQTAKASARGLAVLYSGNRLELTTSDGQNKRRSLRDVPGIVVDLYWISDALMALSFEDGTVGLWSIESGHFLWSHRLRGIAENIWVRSNVLYTVTEVGDTMTQDISDFTRDRCELLGDVWREMPASWEDGRAQLTPPPEIEGCAPLANGAAAAP